MPKSENASTNILQALYNISLHPKQHLLNLYSGRNMINNIGEALEQYIKDAVAGTINIDDTSKKDAIWSNIFSWLGNQNNPPDAIIKGGDAIEVKKIENYRVSTIALNSSYPKHKLYYDDPKLTKACKESEIWVEKDIIYVVGTVEKKENKLTNLWFVYGDCYAADREVYERIKNTIENGITSINEVEFSKTRELGRVNRVDPLGITNLRIRGMWQITNPSLVFEYIYAPKNKVDGLQIACLMKKEKFDLFNENDKKKLYSGLFTIKEVKIKNPNNPASRLDAILITCSCAGE